MPCNRVVMVSCIIINTILSATLDVLSVALEVQMTTTEIVNVVATILVHLATAYWLYKTIKSLDKQRDRQIDKVNEQVSDVKKDTSALFAMINKIVGYINAKSGVPLDINVHNKSQILSIPEGQNSFAIQSPVGLTEQGKKKAAKKVI